MTYKQLTLAIALAVSAACLACRSALADNDLDEAKRLLERYPDSKEHVTEVYDHLRRSATRQSAEANLLLGDLSMQFPNELNADKDSATAYFQAAASAGNSRAFAILAALQCGDDYYTSAAETCTKADQSASITLTVRGWLAASQRDYDASQKLLEQASKCANHVNDACLCEQIKARLYEATNQQEAAIAAYQKASELRPRHRSADAWNKRIAVLKKAITQSPNAATYCNAFDSTSRRWATGLPMRVYVEPYGDDPYKKKLSEAIDYALSSWLSLIPSQTCQYVNEPSQANVIVVCIPDNKYHSHTKTRHNVDGFIDKAIVNIKRIDPHSDILDDELTSICLHEVGHVLGLDHSPNAHDVMYDMVNFNLPTKLSDRDKASLVEFYAKPTNQQ